MYDEEFEATLDDFGLTTEEETLLFDLRETNAIGGHPPVSDTTGLSDVVIDDDAINAEADAIFNE